jgi:hypothetical protein
MRQLVLMPEIHTHGRLDETVREVKALKDPSVKLFLEGVTLLNRQSVSSRAGYPVTPTEHEGIQKASAILAFSYAISRAFALTWSLGNPTQEGIAYMTILGKSLLATRLQLSQLNRTDGPRSIDELLTQEIDHGLDLVKRLGLVDDTAINSIMTHLAQGSLESKLVVFRSLITGMVVKSGIDQAELTKLPGTIDSYFLRAHGIEAKLVSANLHLSLGILTDPSPGVTPIAFDTLVYDTYKQYRVLREAFMAYSVAKEDFSLGYMNLGLGHVTREGLLISLLAETNMQLIAVKERRAI